MMASAMAGACSSSIVSQSSRAPSSIPTISLPFTSKLRNNNTNNYNSKQYSIINNPHHRLFQSKLPPSSTPVSAAQAQQTINPTTSTPSKFLLLPIPDSFFFNEPINQLVHTQTNELNRANNTGHQRRWLYASASLSFCYLGFKGNFNRLFFMYMSQNSMNLNHMAPDFVFCQ